MGKNHKGSHSDTELTAIRRLKLENQKLKKQMSKLRKQLSRIDIDRYSNLKDMLEEQAAEDENLDVKVELEGLKEKWVCHGCKEDYLRVVMVPRADGLFYTRRCASCHHKTKLKRYTDEVDGIGTNGQLVRVVQDYLTPPPKAFMIDVAAAFGGGGGGGGGGAPSCLCISRSS